MAKHESTTKTAFGYDLMMSKLPSHIGFPLPSVKESNCIMGQAQNS